MLTIVAILPVSVNLMDYDDVSTTLTFGACENQSCVNIIIVNDMLHEEDEAFNVTLERAPGLNENITLHPVDTVIEINDDDGMFYRQNNLCFLYFLLLLLPIFLF